MVTPREPDRFDKQARDLWSMRNLPQALQAIAAALRAAGSSALEQAAQIAHQSQEDCFCKGRPDDVPCAACMEASRIEGAIRGTADRALIPPAAAPAACPTPYRCRAGHHDLCPAAAPAAEEVDDGAEDAGPWGAGRGTFVGPAAPAAETGKAQGAEARDAEWLRALTHWQEHPRCGVTMEQMFYDARHPKDPYPSERCDGCDPVRLLLTRALRAAPPEGEGT